MSPGVEIRPSGRRRWRKAVPAEVTLPNSALRGPDTSWISRERWEAVPKADHRRFAHVSPDFVAEIASPSDDRNRLRAGMEE